MENLSNGQKIALGGGILLLISSFLPWYGASGFGVSLNISGWNSGFWAWGGILLGVGGAVLIGLKAFQGSAVSAGGFATEQIAVILAAIGTVFILLRLITLSNGTKFGLFIGLVAAAATAYGAFMAMREVGLDLDVDDFKGKLGGGDAGGGDEPPAPPPPPQ